MISDLATNRYQFATEVLKALDSSSQPPVKPSPLPPTVISAPPPKKKHHLKLFKLILENIKLRLE